MCDELEVCYLEQATSRDFRTTCILPTPPSALLSDGRVEHGNIDMLKLKESTQRQKHESDEGQGTVCSTTGLHVSHHSR